MGGTNDEENLDLEENLDPDDEFEDDDDLEESDGIPDTLVHQATAIGVDASLYDNEQDLLNALQIQSNRLMAGQGANTKAEDEALKTAALDFKFPDKDSEDALSDPVKNNFTAIKNAIEENMKTIDAKIEASGKSPETARMIKNLNAQVAHLQDTVLRSELDTLINSDPDKYKKYFGTGTLASLDPESAQAKRRRVCFKNADKAARTKKPGSFTSLSLFKKSAKKMTSKVKSSAKDAEDDSVTRTSRVSGQRSQDYADDKGDDKAVDPATLKKEARLVTRRFLDK